MIIFSLGHTFGVKVEFGDGAAGYPSPTKPDLPCMYIDTFQGIKKPIYTVRYGTVLPDDAVELAYVSTSEIDADTNMGFADRSGAAPENAAMFVSGEESFTGDTYSSYLKNILITDVTTDAIPSQPIKPLYYKHVLPATADTESVFILDKNFSRINTYLYKVVAEPEYDDDGNLTGDTDYVAVYNNLENTFDDDTGLLTIYYVQYTDSSSGTPVTTTVLLNNSPVYREATFEDIDPVTLQLKSYVKAYIVKQSGNYYYFTLPQSKTYYVKFGDNIRIRALPPALDDGQSPWFVRVTNGSFVHNYLGTLFTYRIPEFRSQLFNPLYPYKFAAGQTGILITDGLVKLPHDNVALDEWPAYFVVKDRSGTVLYAITTDSSKDGQEYTEDGTGTGVYWDTSLLTSYDTNSGIIHLDVALKDYYTIDCTYYYEEHYYEYTLVNFNPLNNPDVLDHIYVLYLVPEAGAASHEASIHHLKVGRDGLIKECSQDGSNGEPDIASSVIGLPYGRPIRIPVPGDGTQDDDGSSAMAALGHEFMCYPQAATGIQDFIKQYTLEAPAGYPGQTSTGRYLILAEVSVVKHQDVTDVVILDTRVRGGGIKEDMESLAKQTNPEVIWYGDIGLGGGMPYPGKSAVIVKLPCYILREYGGNLERDEVTEIVKRHVGFGHYPVIDYYGITPEISLASAPTGESLSISWPSEGNNVTFDIYYTSGDGVFTKHNSSPIQDNASGNTYTISGLQAGVEYGVYVQATVSVPFGLVTKKAADGLPAGQGEGEFASQFSSYTGPRSRILYAVVMS